MASIESDKPRTKVSVVKWLPHKHCPVCGNPMPPDKEFCSLECEAAVEEYKEKKQSKGRNMFLILAPIAVLVVLLVLMSL